MSDLPRGFDFGDGAYCFPQGMGFAARFSYVPGAPRVDIPPMSGGRPMASLMDSPDAAVVSIQAVWDLSDDALAALQAEIPRHYPDAGGRPVGMAQFGEVTASLVVGSGSGAETIGPQQSSGMEPYGVVIQTTLPSNKKSGALEAFNGESGTLSLVYNASFELQEEVKVRIKGDLAAALKALAPAPDKGGDGDDSGGWFGWGKKPKEKPPTPEKEPATLAECRAQVDHAIADGDLQETVEQTPNALDTLKESVSSKVRDSIAKNLLRTLQQLGASASVMGNFGVDQSQSGSETQTYRVERRADLGAWFAANHGASLISQASGPINSAR